MDANAYPKIRFQNLLCDLDGTLIDSGGLRVHFEFIWRTLPLMKKHQGWKAAYRALKDGQEVLKTPSKNKTNYERLVDSFAEHLKLSKKNAEEELNKNLNLVFPKLKPHFKKMKGAEKFLDWAKDEFTLTLATNPVWLKELVHLRMQWGGIDPDFFRSITTSDRMHACKPSPEYYLELLKQERFIASQTLMIGNERKMDLPAKEVGIAVFLIRTDATKMTCLEKPSLETPGAWRGNYTHLKAFLIENLKLPLNR